MERDCRGQERRGGEGLCHLRTEGTSRLDRFPGWEGCPALRREHRGPVWRGGAQGSWSGEARGEKAREGAGLGLGEDAGSARGRQEAKPPEAGGGGGAEGRDPALGGDPGLGGGREEGGTVGGCCDNEGSKIRETEGNVGRSGWSGHLPKVMPAGSADGLAVDFHRKGRKEVNPFPVMDN